MDPVNHPELIGEMIFYNESVDSFGDAVPGVLYKIEENPYVQQLAKKERFTFDLKGKPFSKMKQYQLCNSIFETIIDRFYKDSSLVACGKENLAWLVVSVRRQRERTL
jgi:2-oxoisovalerate dehydrogenase E1 component